MSNLKVEGKVGDFCLKCKNCKGITKEYDGKTASIRMTEVECEDPYDGMVKTLNIDSDICCSMFDPKPPCEKCERFDGTYCHSPDGIFVTSYISLFGESGNCPSYEEKKEKEPCDKISLLQHELEMEKLRTKIHQLEKEKAAHLKGIERLKKSQEKLQNQVKNLQTTNEESYKREEKLEDKCHKLERRLLDENKEKDKKISELESSRDAWSNTATARAEQVIEVTKDRDKWRKLYNSLSETCADYDKRCKEECEKKYRDEISKLQNIVTEKDVEIKDLKRGIMTLTYDRETINNIRNKNIKLNQTISDQEITIKALLITIKEMCKEDETNA